MSQRTDELERAASAGEPMPPGLTDYEMDYFMFMRGLYWQYRQGIVDREQAKKEKYRRQKKFEICKNEAEARAKSMRVWQFLNLRIEDDDCPKCKELKKRILQLENCF